MMYVFSKQINENIITGGKITRDIDKENISNVMTSLREIGTLKNLDYLELKENCRAWVIEILSGYSEKNEAALKYVMNDFTDSMMTRMREEKKYVISIVSKHYLILCHSRGGESITPRWDVVKRMLDKDNVERFVIFMKEGEIVKVYYYEHYPSEFFTIWLGIPEKEAFYYLGGKNRIYSEIDGMKCAIELSDDDIEKLFLKEQSTFKIEKNQFF